MPKPIQTVRSCLSDLRFLMHMAKRLAPQVLRDAVLCATASVAVALVELVVAFSVMHAAFGGTSSTAAWLIVCGITVAWVGVCVWQSYAAQAFERSQDTFRTRACTALTKRALTLSYPLAVDGAQKRLLRRAADAMGRHIQAPAVHMWHTLSQLMGCAVGALAAAVLLSRLSGWLTAATVLTAMLSAWVHHHVTVRGAVYEKEEAAADAQLSELNRVSESADYAKDIRVFGMAGWLRELHDRTMQTVRGFVERRAKIYVLFSLADALLVLARNAIAFAVLIGMAGEHAWTPAQALWYPAAVGLLAQSVSGIGRNGWILAAECPSLSAYRRYMEQDEPFLTKGGALPLEGSLHTVELRHVSFRYPDTERFALRDVSLVWHEGERLAVVGRDGVGKTTLAYLLCGLFDPDEGAVLIDGMDIRTMDRRAVYRLFSTVFHHTVISDMTVAQGIAGSDAAENEDRVWACLKQAGIENAVRALPQGVHTLLGQSADGGVMLSRGQMQRLLLAAALYKDGDLLLFDEPTASLDPLARQALYREYDRMTEGKGAVLLSHRTDAAHRFDRVLVLKDGCVAEEGTHEELMTRGGEYAALVALQRRYDAEGRDPDAVDAE